MSSSGQGTQAQMELDKYLKQLEVAFMELLSALPVKDKSLAQIEQDRLLLQTRASTIVLSSEGVLNLIEGLKARLVLHQSLAEQVQEAKLAEQRKERGRQVLTKVGLFQQDLQESISKLEEKEVFLQSLLSRK